MHSDDEDVMRESKYWYFAHHFGWTPQKVDAQYQDRLVLLREIEEEYKKMETEANK